jgi:hypothetical protein
MRKGKPIDYTSFRGRPGAVWVAHRAAFNTRIEYLRFVNTLGGMPANDTDIFVTPFRFDAPFLGRMPDPRIRVAGPLKGDITPVVQHLSEHGYIISSVFMPVHTVTPSDIEHWTKIIHRLSMSVNGFTVGLQGATVADIDKTAALFSTHTLYVHKHPAP